MLGELLPYERRKEYYTTIQLGQDVAHQTDILRKQTNAMIAAQAASANATLASQDRIREGISGISYKIEEGMEGLKAAFEFGISEVVWQIEQNRQVMKNILDVLLAPLDTQAKELRIRAQNAYANGWFDEALEDFLDSEKKNRYDFCVHISIGLIYLFQKVNREKALEYLDKAVKYAKPKSPYHASFALLHAALIKRDFNLMKEAEELSSQASELSPHFTEALYQNAQYNAQLKNTAKSMARLERAIRLDSNYCLKANSDSMFDPIRCDVNALYVRLRDELIDICEKNYVAFRSSLNEIEKTIDQPWMASSYKIALDSLSRELSDIRQLLDRRSYFDSLAAIEKITAFSADGRKYVEKAVNYFNSVSAPSKKELRLTHERLVSKALKKGERLRSVAWFACIVFWLSCIFALFYYSHPWVAVILFFAGMAGGDRLDSILFKNVHCSVGVASNEERLKTNISQLESDMHRLGSITFQLVAKIPQNISTVNTTTPTVCGKTHFDVILSAAGNNKYHVIRLIRELTGLQSEEATEIAYGVGDTKLLKKGVSREEADYIKAKMQEQGATIEIV